MQGKCLKAKELNILALILMFAWIYMKLVFKLQNEYHTNFLLSFWLKIKVSKKEINYFKFRLQSIKFNFICFQTFKE